MAQNTVRPPSKVTATTGPILIAGTGLIGTSIALALRERGVDVYLTDPSPVALALAIDMGAGRLYPTDAADEEPRLVVVAAPPDISGATCLEYLRRFPRATVTDVASVKTAVIGDVVKGVKGVKGNEGNEGSEGIAGGDADQQEAILARFVGSHPMAGRARSGASSAHGDLFYGRPWVIVPTAWSSVEATRTVRDLAVDLGSVPVELGPQEHDSAVDVVSHVPQLVSSLLAARLTETTPEALSLAGQGLRDTVRIAASDPSLWTAIIAGNAGPVAQVLAKIRDDLDALLEPLSAQATLEDFPLAPGAARAISETIANGNEGVSRIPGKHGGAPRRWAAVEVLVPDRPGELGRLFTELGDAGISIEDLSLDHSAEQPVGLARIMVVPERAEDAERELSQRGWRVANRGAQ